MKLTILLFLFSVSFYSHAQKSKIKKGPTKDLETEKGRGVLLAYSGSFVQEDIGKLEVGYHVEMVSDVGIRWDIVIEKGDMVMSHQAIFYKFSSPDQTILYDFIRKQSKINGSSSTNGGDDGITELGEVKIDSFTCTHLEYKSDSHSKEVIDFFESWQVPGAEIFAKALANIDLPNPFGYSINPPSTILSVSKWGILVRMNITTSGNKGSELFLKLVEANPDIMLPLKDFEIPNK